MTNKKILGLTGLATLGLALSPLGVVSADDNGGALDSNAQVTFTADNDSKSPLDPTTPANPDGTQNPVSPIDTVTGTTPNPGTTGLLTVDFASSFNFGSHTISSVNKTYNALPQSYSQKDESKATATSGPNFVQVTDLRSGSAKGWSLKVKQIGDFKTTDGTSLVGAQINIANGNVLNGNGGADTISKHSANIAVSTADTDVMGAKTGEGFGTWLYRMGNNDTAGSSVTLTVPGSSAKEAAAYRTTLTWTLTDSPAS